MKRAIGYLLSVAVLIGMLSGMLMMPATVQRAEASVTVGDGDYNGDGRVNTIDYMAITQYINGTKTMTSVQKQSLDVFADGVVDAYDAACLFRYINEATDTLGGEAQASEEVYARLSLECAAYTQPLAIGDTVELELTAAEMAKLVSLELHLAYDGAVLCFAKASKQVEGLSLSANASPVSVNGSELWISAVSSDPIDVAEDTVIATLTFDVIAPITGGTAISFASAKAVSERALDGLYTQVSTGQDGGVSVEAATTTTTQHYITYTIETVSHEEAVKAGETVELDISVSAVSDFNGMQLNLCFDDEQWEWIEGSFVGTLASFNQKVNVSPAHPMTDKGEVWLTAMAMRKYALAEGEVIATVTLKAKQDITTDSVIGACYSQVSSYDGTKNGYVPSSAWIDGGVEVYYNVTVEYVTDDGVIHTVTVPNKGGELEIPNPPADPEEFNYAFIGWSSFLQENGTVRMTPIFGYVIETVNGTIDSASVADDHWLEKYTKAYFNNASVHHEEQILGYDAHATIVADEAPAGQVFSHWVDQYGNTVSYESTYSFFVPGNLTLTAVYDDQAPEQTPSVSMQIVRGVYDADAGTGAITWVAAVNRGDTAKYTVTECGIVYSPYENYGLLLSRDETWTRTVTASAVSKGSAQYSVKITGVADGASRSAVAYAVYTDKETGESITIYSPTVLTLTVSSEV